MNNFRPSSKITGKKQEKNNILNIGSPSIEKNNTNVNSDFEKNKKQQKIFEIKFQYNKNLENKIIDNLENYLSERIGKKIF